MRRNRENCPRPHYGLSIFFAAPEDLVYGNLSSQAIAKEVSHHALVGLAWSSLWLIFVGPESLATDFQRGAKVGVINRYYVLQTLNDFAPGRPYRGVTAVFSRCSPTLVRAHDVRVSFL